MHTNPLTQLLFTTLLLLASSCSNLKLACGGDDPEVNNEQKETHEQLPTRPQPDQESPLEALFTYLDEDDDLTEAMEVYQERREKVAELMAYGRFDIRTNLSDQYGTSLLSWLVRKDYEDAFLWFMERRENHLKGSRHGIGDEGYEAYAELVNQTDLYGMTALHHAAKKGNPVIISKLLADKYTTVDCKNKTGYTALELAIIYHGIDHEAVKKFLHHFKIKTDNYKGRGPLHYAVMAGHLAIMKSLLKAQEIDINHKTTKEHTALHYAAFFNKPEIAKVLLQEKGIDPNCIDKNLRTPVHIGAHKGSFDTLEVLLGDNRVKSDERDIDGCTPLYDIALSGNKKFVDILLQKGAKVDSRNTNDRTPLDDAKDEEIKERLRKALREQTGSPNSQE